MKNRTKWAILYVLETLLPCYRGKERAAIVDFMTHVLMKNHIRAADFFGAWAFKAWDLRPELDPRLIGLFQRIAILVKDEDSEENWEMLELFYSQASGPPLIALEE